MYFYFLLAATLFTAHLNTEEIPITLEIAKTPEQRAWGLMKRSQMPKDHGMLFSHLGGCMWMFNTFMDLSVAFLDEDGNIIEIAELKSYPEKMDPKRPVNNLQDMWKYPHGDKVNEFFLKHSYPIPCYARYALEMNSRWFPDHAVKVGDKVTWDEGSSTGMIKKRAQ